MKRGASFYLGLFIIVIGSLILLTNLDMIHINWYDFWVLILWAIGLSFEFGYFFGDSNEPAYLVPGGIITTIAFIFTVCVIFGWSFMSILWPLFILAPAFGLFQLYLFGKRERALLIPVGVLGLIGGVFLLNNVYTFNVASYIVPAVLILLGLILVTSRQ